MSAVRRPWFLRDSPDVLVLLAEQGRVTHETIGWFAEWSATGDEDLARRVRAGEHAGDDVRHELLRALRSLFQTPLDQEDLYTVSERLDEVLNQAKNTVREAEVLGWKPDEHAAAMGAALHEAVDHLVSALSALPDESAANEAARAVKASRAVERRYRRAVASLLHEPQAQALAGLEIARRYPAIAEAVVRTAHRVWYSVLKEE